MVLNLCKLISIFQRDYLEKLIVTFLPIDSTPSMARPIIKFKAEISSIKQKYGQPAKVNGISKHAKKC